MKHECNAADECPIDLFIRFWVSVFKNGIKCPIFMEGPVDYEQVVNEISACIKNESATKPVEKPIEKISLEKIVNVNQWKLTLPKVENYKLVELKSPQQIKEYSDENFYLNSEGLVMKASCDASTTPNSKYPRCEFREYSGAEVFWDSTDKPRTLQYKVAALHLPKNKPEIVVGQLHDKKDDVFEVKFSGLPKPTLKVFHDSEIYGSLGEYEINEYADISIEVVKGMCKIVSNKGSVSFKMSSSTSCYFKVGCYVQSNSSKGDGGDYGAVVYKSIVLK